MRGNPGQFKLERVHLREFAEPIYDAITEYNRRADGAVSIYPTTATGLELTPDKPNSARSVTPLLIGTEKIADLYTIVFAPHDGTGDENTYRAEDLEFARRYPQAAKVVPRSKAAADCEAHLTILSKDLENKFADPVLFAGNLDLLGFPAAGNTVDRIGTLGQSHDLFTNAIDTEWQPEPAASLTTAVPESADANTGERYGDPHAVFNRWSTVVQVAGFVALEAGASARHRDALSHLGIDRRLLGLEH